MVAYFRGFCWEKLGQSGANDYRTASRLSTAYIFPNTAEEFAVLRAALRENPRTPSRTICWERFYSLAA